MKLEDLFVCKKCGTTDLDTNKIGHIYCWECCNSADCLSDISMDCESCPAVTNVVAYTNIVIVEENK